jgi:hypothetical protein
MSEENRLRLIAEVKLILEQFLNSVEVPQERKTQVLRDLLAIQIKEEKND